MAEYVLPIQSVKPWGFEVDKIYPFNAFKVFDLIAENIDNQTGNQAYFAIIDLPSDTYMYDEFCQIKNMSDWLSEKEIPFAKASKEAKRIAYADQVNCVMGELENFVRYLKKIGQFDNTTIVISGLNNPQNLFMKEKDFYRNIQSQKQVLFAIKPENNKTADIDYSVCDVSEIIDSYLMSKKPCENFANIKTTEKNIKQIKSLVEDDRIAEQQINKAVGSFKEWMNAWNAYNQNANNFETAPVSEAKADQNKQNSDNTMVVEEVKTTNTIVEDVPEQKMETISKVAEDINIEKILIQICRKIT